MWRPRNILDLVAGLLDDSKRFRRALAVLLMLGTFVVLAFGMLCAACMYIADRTESPLAVVPLATVLTSTIAGSVLIIWRSLRRP